MCQSGASPCGHFLIMINLHLPKCKPTASWGDPTKASFLLLRRSKRFIDGLLYFTQRAHLQTISAVAGLTALALGQFRVLLQFHDVGDSSLVLLMSQSKQRIQVSVFILDQPALRNSQASSTLVLTLWCSYWRPTWYQSFIWCGPGAEGALDVVVNYKFQVNVVVSIFTTLLKNFWRFHAIYWNIIFYISYYN